MGSADRETADHSLPYMLAIALRDGRITPASFEPQRYLDPSLRPLMNRIRVAESPEFTRRFPQELRSQIDGHDAIAGSASPNEPSIRRATRAIR